MLAQLHSVLDASLCRKPANILDTLPGPTVASDHQTFSCAHRLVGLSHCSRFLRGYTMLPNFCIRARSYPFLVAYRSVSAIQYFQTSVFVPVGREGGDPCSLPDTFCPR